MNIIVVGAGKIGSLLCKDLVDEGHDVFLIEQNEELLEDMLSKYDINGVVCNGASLDVLVDSEIDNCDVFISVTSQDEINLLACMIAKQLGAKYTIARTRNEEYRTLTDIISEVLGISMIINPDLLSAQQILLDIAFPQANYALNLKSKKYNYLNML